MDVGNIIGGTIFSASLIGIADWVVVRRFRKRNAKVEGLLVLRLAQLQAAENTISRLELELSDLKDRVAQFGVTYGEPAESVEVNAPEGFDFTKFRSLGRPKAAFVTSSDPSQFTAVSA